MQAKCPTSSAIALTPNHSILLMGPLLHLHSEINPNPTQPEGQGSSETAEGVWDPAYEPPIVVALPPPPQLLSLLSIPP